jgi:hypothetical protein
MKRILRIICTNFVLSFLCFKTMAQTAPRPNGNYYNLEKYWFYRYRLINDFMKIGPNCGESLPFQERIKCRWDWPTTHEPHTFNGGGETLINLGDYIGVLSTEHRLLSTHLLSTGRTEYELDMALNAFERLDKNAEIYTSNFYSSEFYDTTSCPSPNEGTLNGYFIREDFPYTRFINQNFNHFNRPGSLTKLTPNTYTLTGLKRYEEIIVPSSHPDYWYRPSTDHPGRTINKCVPHEESKDGTINLSVGFALTTRFLGKSSALGIKAAGNFQRMVEYVHDGSRPGSPGWPHLPWTIINPISQKCVFGDSRDNLPCQGGGSYRESVFGAVDANEKWGNSRPGLKWAVDPGLSSLYQLSQWITWTRDYHFWGNWAALGNNFYAVPTGLLSILLAPPALLFMPILPPGVINMTWFRMKQYAVVQDEGQPQLPYLYRVMYPGKGSIFMPIETQIKLDVAPPCGIHDYQGNFSTGIGTYELNGTYAWHWSGSNLLANYQKREKFRVPGVVFPIHKNEHIDFNGLDYMLLFNLYSLQDYYLMWMFNSYYKENFNLNFPDKVRTPQETGSYHRQLKLNFLEYVSAINTVNSDGYFTMRCAKAIDLKPGFEAKTGSRFLAYIEDYEIDCGDVESKRPSEEYHYAEIVQKPGWDYEPQGVAPQSQNDTTFALDFPPDGVEYIPDSSVLTSQDEDTVTCEMAMAYFDSLVAIVYASGDPDQIAYIDSLIPYVTFPECDSAAAPSYMGASGGGGANGNNQQNAAGSAYANRLMAKLLDKQKDGTDFNIFPNPNNGNFTVAFANVGEYEIRLYNSLGMVVFQTHVYNRRSEIVHINDLPNGVYTAEVVNSTGNPNKKIRKIVIAR